MPAIRLTARFYLLEMRRLTASNAPLRYRRCEQHHSLK
jgi:hypothetical protein